MSAEIHHAGHRALRLALLWLLLIAACAGLAQHMLELDTRIRWEQHIRDDVRGDMAVYDVRQPDAWTKHQREVDARIAARRREQNIARGLFFVVALLGLAATVWLFWPDRAATK